MFAGTVSLRSISTVNDCYIKNYSGIFRTLSNICDGLRDLVPPLQFKKREKHGICAHGTKSRKPPHLRRMFVAKTVNGFYPLKFFTKKAFCRVLNAPLLLTEKNT